MNSRSRGVLGLVDAASSDALRSAARDEGLDATVVSTLSELLERLRDRSWSATVLSLSVDPVDADVAVRIGEERTAGALLLAARGASLERALLAERAGAMALLREPLDRDELRAQLSRSLDEGPEVPLPDLPAASHSDEEPPALIGESPALAQVFQMVAQVADSAATVLITGESGTGKEVVARALHWASGRREHPFVAVNCAAIPEQLLESELFGHEKGAFTGAVARRFGRFERASKGTLFLDEIGDMSIVLQAKVLRALEERSVERVGGEKPIPVDVRVVAATNRDLGRAIEDGEFREDLYFRLAVVELSLPPLRERGSDVRTLALHFAAELARRHDRQVRAITQRALARLETAPWPGNVRELRNVMDRAVLLAKGGTIRSGDLRLGSASPTASASTRAPAAGYAPTLSLEAVEADHIRRVLEHAGGHIGEAAEILGIHRNTLARKMKSHGLDT